MTFPITVAYNLLQRKIGCPHVQRAMSSDCSDNIVLLFDPRFWETKSEECKLFSLMSQQDLEEMIGVTEGNMIHLS